MAVNFHVESTLLQTGVDVLYALLGMVAVLKSSNGLDGVKGNVIIIGHMTCWQDAA